MNLKYMLSFALDLCNINTILNKFSKYKYNLINYETTT